MSILFEPQVLNIYNPDTGDLIGVRDSVTGVFTPDAAFPNMELISDVVCTQPVGNLQLVTDNGIAVIDGGEFVFEIVT